MTLPTPKELKKIFPLLGNEGAAIATHRQMIASCLAGLDDRIVLIVGPCSLHNQQSALTYAGLLKELQDEVEETFLLVMRAYVEKPRTCHGWKGSLYNPQIDTQDDLTAGLNWTRDTLLKLAKTNLPLATEFLEPLAAPYFEDLISLGFIGSRTTTSQIHRQLASSLDLPIGFKNTPDGSTISAIESILSGATPHTFFHIDENGNVISKKSRGNPHTYLTLRGADSGPNYDSHSVAEALNELKKRDQPERLIIDCSHGNSGKDIAKQLTALHDVTEQIAKGQKGIRAIMLESHLLEGNQRESKENHPSKSMTDPCLDWETTRHAILWAHQALSSKAAAAEHIPHPLS